MRDEALFCWDVLRKIPHSLLSLERVLHTFDATQKFPGIPVSTREENRGSCNKSGRAPFFPPHLKMRVPFPASSGKESRRSRRTSRRGTLKMKVERNSRGHASIPKDSDVPVHSRYTSFHCTDSTVILGIESKRMAGVTALWHLDRKPEIPM